MGRHSLIVPLLLCVSVAAASEIEIVKNGMSDYVVLIPVKASPIVRFAADELARYVKQMSGAALEIESGESTTQKVIQLLPDDSPDMPALRLMFDGVKVIIVAKENELLHGAYGLLDTFGCRFLAPQFSHYSGSGEIIPSKENLPLQLGGFTRTPKLQFRKLYVEEGHSHTPENLVQIVEWMPKVGYNTLVVPTNYQGNDRVKWDNFREKVIPECQKRGIIIEVGGHGYQNFLNAEMEEGKLFEQHSEWFGANAQGKRQKAKGWVPCTSNDEAVAYLINNFVRYINERPEIQIYDFWPPDGAKWCECEKCKALGTPSDRQAILVAKVKESARSVRPELRLEVLAYHTSVYPPRNVKLDKSILLDFCPIAQQFDYQIIDPAAEKNADYVKGLTAWRKAFDGDISIYSYYRKYAWDSLPVIIPHYMQKDLQWYATLPAQGVSTYAEPGDWFTYELNHYVLARLAWAPNADVDALVKKFCEARYGEHADAAQTTLLTLGDVTRNTCSIPNTSLKSIETIEADYGRVLKIEQGINAEAQRAKNPTVQRNLQRLGLMCQYARRDLEIQKLRAAKGSADEIRKLAAELHQFVSTHADDGVFLVRNHRLSPTRMLRRYGMQPSGAAN